jgi:hypothetical protein
MDTETLIKEAKARFNHNSAKHYLKEKYEARLIVADQNGLWKADLPTLTFLSSSFYEEVIMVDTFENPVKVNRKLLLDKLLEVYDTTMEAWLKEWQELENKR